jgi:hypothetical protein
MLSADDLLSLEGRKRPSPGATWLLVFFLEICFTAKGLVKGHC